MGSNPSLPSPPCLATPLHSCITLFPSTAAKILRETKEDIVEPLEIREDELLVVHTQEYLNSLKVSSNPV